MKITTILLIIIIMLLIATQRSEVNIKEARNLNVSRIVMTREGQANGNIVCIDAVRIVDDEPKRTIKAYNEEICTQYK